MARIVALIGRRGARRGARGGARGRAARTDAVALPAGAAARTRSANSRLRRRRRRSAQTQLDDGSIGAREALLIAVGIVALIGGIWFVIARDAKRVTAGRVRTADGALGEAAAAARRAPSRRSRRLSADERRRRKRGRAR